MILLLFLVMYVMNWLQQFIMGKLNWLFLINYKVVVILFYLIVIVVIVLGIFRYLLRIVNQVIQLINEIMIFFDIVEGDNLVVKVVSFF